MEFFFSEHHLDVDRRELRRGAELIAVEPQVFDLLVYLVRNRDRVICKDELIATVWRGRIVSDSTLTSHIHAVRKAVGDSGAAQRLIRTVPRKGIRFVGALKEERTRSLAGPPAGVVDPATQVLTATRGHVVSTDELIARRWPGGVVEEANIPGRGSRLTGRESAGLEEPPTVQVPSLLAKPTIMVDRDEPQDRPPIVERRQLTVISGELVGLAQLATRLDLEELSTVTAAFSHCCSETIARFGGTVAQLAGDEMLAYFGYPQAEEHDAEQVLRAGLALVSVRRLEPVGETLRLRLGIATGPVVIGDLIGGNDEHGLLGDAVNLAAGLRRIPTPNPIVIAASTRRLVGDLFATRDIPDLQIHGLVGTGEAYEVLGPGTVDSRFEALHGSSLTALVGREEEIELLLRRWQRIKTGEIRVVLVTGEAGIGKSRLCVELQKRIRMEPHTFLRYFCSPHHQDSALYSVMRQLESAAGFERNDTVEQKRAKIRTLFAQVSVSAGEVDLIAELLSLSPITGAPPAEFSPRRRRQLTFELLIRQIEATALEQPILMIFEDVHWSDPTSLELLDLMMTMVARRPILLLITFRPEFAAPWIGQPHVTTITLSRLDRWESTALIRKAVGADALNSDLVNEIAQRTDGIPLFLEELSKALVESQWNPGIGAPGVPSPSRTIPATLHASLTARLDRLNPSTREVAQAGAAIGREFSYELIAAVCEGKGAGLDAALENLVGSGLVFRRGIPPSATFSFKHGLVQDAVYSTLLRSKRRQLHADIAGALGRLFPETLQQQPELLGHHFTAAEQPKAAMPYWCAAAKQALRTNAYREAVGHCTRGLQAIDAIEPRQQRLREELSLRLQQGIALTASLGPSAPVMLEAFSCALAIAEELEDDRALASALLGLWAHHNARAYLRPALAFAQRLFAIGQSRGEKAVCVQAHAASLTVSYKMGAFEDAWRHFQRGTALYRPGMQIIEAIPNYTSPGPDMLLHGSFVAWVMGYPERARKLAAETMTAAGKLNQPYTLTHCVYMLGHLAELQEDWRAVRRANEQTVELATRWGFTGTMELVGRRISLVAVAIDHDEEQFRVKCEHRQPGFARPLHDVVLARMCGLLGNAEQGLELLDEALTYSQECGSCFYDAEVYRTQGQLLASLRRWPEAENSYLRSIETARRQCARMWELRAATDIATLWADRGERGKATDLLAPIYGWFTEGLDMPDLQAARAVLRGLDAPSFDKGDLRIGVSDAAPSGINAIFE